jgi:hypothetical protein
MKQIKVLWFFALFISMISCDKNENPPTGYADKVAGTYQGAMYHEANPWMCTSQVMKTGDKKVTIKLFIDGSSFVFADADVTNAGNNTYNLTYTEQSGYLNGKVEGNTLTYSINAGVLNDIFTGSR